jgi:energy-coupling factor transporter transmembrane protein EcfT
LIANLTSLEVAFFLTLVFILVAVLVYFVAKRTLWELLQLLSALAIPIVLAAAEFWFTAQLAGFTATAATVIYRGIFG